MDVFELLKGSREDEFLREYQCHLEESHRALKAIVQGLDDFSAETRRKRAIDILETVRSELYDHLVKHHLGMTLELLDRVRDELCE